MAKHLFDQKDFVNAYTIAYVADKLPGFLENHDHIYMEVSQINQRKQSSEIRQKNEQRQFDNAEIMKHIDRINPSLK